MKPSLANLINAIILILMGLWAYYDIQGSSLTSLIPVFTGLILLILSPFIFRGNRMIMYVALVLTGLIFLALFRPLYTAFVRNNNMALLRVVVMMISSAYAIYIFIVNLRPEK